MWGSTHQVARLPASPATPGFAWRRICRPLALWPGALARRRELAQRLLFTFYGENNSLAKKRLGEEAIY